MKKISIPFLIIVLTLLVGGLIFLAFQFSKENTSLRGEIQKVQSEKDSRERLVQKSFLDGADNAAAADTKLYFETKNRLLASHQKFVEVDLTKMQLVLFENGSPKETISVRTKGREGSWWETPIGEYKVLSKAANHFSSIGDVWMPWSIQFYGNFFIHGWPYYSDGREVEQRYSGGCIRLGTDDAKKVYDFVTRDTPILIYEESGTSTVKAVVPQKNTLTPLNVSAEGVLVADIDSGEVLLGKNEMMPMPIASLTKLMTAVVASEVIYLERGVTVTPTMLRDSVQSYPLESGKNYRAFNLFFPLLMESSNGSARALASFLGEGEFIRQMNEKAKTLGMTETAFVDPAGIGEGNVATLRDLARLAKNIADKRLFVFDIGRGKSVVPQKDSVMTKIKNFNEFADDPRLIGMKNGETVEAKQSLLSVWQLTDSTATQHRIFIGVLRYENRKQDTEIALQWIQDNFAIK
jgi:hypothetical protein